MPIIAVPGISVCFDLGWVCACISRLLLLVAAVEVITMPLTQHFWTWDKFLHGGQDFELGLLMVVTCLCFVLLRAQHCRQRLSLLLAIGSFLLLIFQRSEWARLIQLSTRSDACGDLPPSSPSHHAPLPLLI